MLVMDGQVRLPPSLASSHTPKKPPPLCQGFKSSLGQRPDKLHFPKVATCFKNRSHAAFSPFPCRTSLSKNRPTGKCAVQRAPTVLALWSQLPSLSLR